ncbi:MAG: hypothetical protein IPI04_01290 [Ignavibacteria bacterium]|nr:hypothetical protein [Ignavibacteria bacterium]
MNLRRFQFIHIQKGASDDENLKGHKADAKSINDNVEEINQEKEKENIAEPVIRKEKLKFGFGKKTLTKSLMKLATLLYIRNSKASICLWKGAEIQIKD